VDQPVNSQGNVCPLCVTRITEKRHFLIHSTADWTSPREIWPTANKNYRNECEDSKEKSQEEPSLDSPPFSVGNERRQHSTDQPKDDYESFHYGSIGYRTKLISECAILAGMRLQNTIKASRIRFESTVHRSATSGSASGKLDDPASGQQYHTSRNTSWILTSVVTKFQNLSHTK
jgi:hypothetical protein